MATRTYKARAIVLRKRKLKESDSIVTFIDSEGERREAVAHGARRPGSSLAGRMELYSEVDIVCSKGRNLDVVSDCRLASDAKRRFGMAQSVCAAPLAELLCALVQPGLKQERLFELAGSSFDYIAASQAELAPAYTAAALLKACAIAGLRPSFTSCVICGEALEPGLSTAAFSCLEGGTVCGSCRRPYDAVVIDRSTLDWCNALLFARYADIETLAGADKAAYSVLEVARSWIFAHVGLLLKSLDMLMGQSFAAFIATEGEEPDAV